MMSAKIRLLKSNIIKNRNANLFIKKIFPKTNNRSKLNNITTDITMTKSTRISENNLTDILPSSKYRSSMNKEDSLFTDLGDFHKKFLISKNNSINKSNLTNYYNSNNTSPKKATAIKKNSITTPFYFSSSDVKSQIKPIIKKGSLQLRNNDRIKSIKFAFPSLKDEKDENIFNNYKRINNFKVMKTLENNNFKPKLLNADYLKIKEQIFLHKNLNLFKNYSRLIQNNNNDNSSSTRYKSRAFSFSEEVDNSKFNFFYNKVNNQKKKDKMKLYYHRNNANLMDKLAYPNIYDLKTENAQEFFYKTRIIIFYNYRKYLNNNAYLKHHVKKDFEFERELIQERNLQMFDKLFTTYEKEISEYFQFLYKKYRIIQDENEKLMKDKYRLMLEIDKLKIGIMKGMSEIRNGFAVKYFLTRVKNHTLSEENFCPEDLKEIREDKKKLSESYYQSLVKRRRSFKRQNTNSNISLNGNPVRKMLVHSLTKKFNRTTERELSNFVKNSKKKNSPKKITRNNEKVKFTKRFKVINSLEEFYEHLDFITNNVYNLIVESNDKYISNVYLKLELENLSKNISNNSNHSDYLQEQINLNENKLKELKLKNKLLVSNLNKLKAQQFQKDPGHLLLIKCIHKLYYNIKKENKEIIDINKDMVITFGERFYLKIIEQFFCKMLFEVDKIKTKKPYKYKIFKLELDKYKKKNAFYNFQRLLAEKIQIKIDKVLQKANKIIYKPHKKTNDYKKEIKKQKVVKKEIKKSDLEIFDEYLYND